MSGRALLGASVLLLIGGEAWADPGPTLHPSAQPYAVKSSAAATGRAGNAQLSVRALHSKNGSTSVEVTTGQLDGGAPSVGNIVKLQLKTYDGVGEVSGTRNYTGLSNTGYLQYTFTELVVGQPFQTQAHIKGVDGKRTDVVTVTGTVKKRPDLAVRRIGLPQTARIGAPVNVSATIAEVGGEVGARANCVLRIEGVVADHADGIWVDGGDTVSCVFTHQFVTTGQKTVSVTLESAVPADDDGGNDSGGATIDILGSGMPLDSYQARFDSTTGAYSGYSRGFYRLDAAPPMYDSGEDWNYQWTKTERNELSFARLQGSQRLLFPLDVAVTEIADGITFSTISRSGVDGDEQWGDALFGGASVVVRDPEWNAVLWIDSYRDEGGASTHVQYERSATRAVYLGTGYTQYWYQYADDTIGTYRYDVADSITEEGSHVSPTATYAISFEIEPTDGSGGLSVALDVPLVETSQQQDEPEACAVRSWSNFNGDFVHDSCDERHSVESGVSGSASSPQ